MPFAYLLTSSVALLTSTLGMLVRDTQMIMQALMRILFYMSPILWVPKNHGVKWHYHKIMMFNPVYFIAESYRAAILFHQWYFIDHWKLMLYNICIIIVFLVQYFINVIEIILLISCNTIYIIALVHLGSRHFENETI